VAISDETRWLAEFAQTGSQEAFTKLVNAHVDLVYSAALRQVHDRQLAEDVTQMVFLALAQKAKSLTRETVPAAWLVVTTRYVAINLSRKERRRKRREHEAAAMAKTTQNPPEIDAWDSLSPQLDEVLSSLGSKDRRVVVLRFLQGKSLTEVAAIVGITHDAARQRLHRAIERMRAMLQARGVRVAPAALGPALAAHAVGTAPAHLASAIVSAASSGAAAAGSTSLLTKGAFWAMASLKTKVAIVAAAAVVVVGGGTAAVVKLSRSSDTESLAIHRQPAPIGGSSDQFRQVYALGDNEVVKLVRPPFIPERAELARRARVSPNADYSLVLQWDGSGFAMGTRMVTIGPSDLRNVVFSATGVNRWDLDDPSEVLNVPVVGDWVVRKGASRDEVMAALAKVASTQFERPIEFVKKPSSRQVIVIRAGTASTTSAPSQQTDELPWTQHGTVESLVAQLSGAADRQVIDQSGRPRMKLSWRMEQFGTLDELLEHVSRQTSLRISAETRSVDMWSIVNQEAPPLADWRMQFQKTYGLADGEVLKHIAPPYGPERRAWWDATRREHDYDLRPGWTMMFDFDGTTKYQTSVSPGSLDVGLRACFGDWNFSDWFGNIDASVPVGMNVGGDWVVRVGATTEQKMAALGPIVSKHLGRPVHFEKRRVTQDVIVARGSFAARSAGEVIDVSAESSSPSTLPPARTTLDRLVKEIGWSVQVPVLDETSTPDVMVAYRVNGPYTKQVESVLTSVARQTGLSFSREKRDRDVWFMVDSGTASKAQ
jgi:RNA polymerase sigma factor (sigma-70 family)